MSPTTPAHPSSGGPTSLGQSTGFNLIACATIQSSSAGTPISDLVRGDHRTNVGTIEPSQLHYPKFYAADLSGASITREYLDRTGLNLVSRDPCLVELLNVPEVRLLEHRRQSGVSYAHHGAYMMQSRLDHSVDVAESAARIAKSLGLPPHQQRLARVAGALHDAGHVAFSHTGERVLGSVYGKAWDHDIHGYDLIRNSQGIGAVLQKYGVKVQDVLAVLDDRPVQVPLNAIANYRLAIQQGRKLPGNYEPDMIRHEIRRFELGHIRFLVKEVADRAYVRTDIMSTEFRSALKDNCLRAFAEFERSFAIAPEPDSFGRRQVYFLSELPLTKVLHWRKHLFQEYSASLATKAVTRWMIRAIDSAIVDGSLTPAELKIAKEGDVVAKLSDRYRPMFEGSWRGTGARIDDFIEPLWGFSFSAIKPEKRNAIVGEANSCMNSTPFAAALKFGLAQRGFSADELNGLEMIRTENFGKVYDGEDKTGIIVYGGRRMHCDTSLSPADRFLALTADREIGKEKIEQARRFSMELLGYFLESNAVPLENPFGRRDQSLYANKF